MKRCVFLLCVLSNFAFADTTSVLTGKWKVVEKESTVTFKIKNAGIDLHGTISGISGTCSFTKDSSKINLKAQAKTVNTGISLRDKEIMNIDFLDVEYHPVLYFNADSVQYDTLNQKYTALGALKIKGLTEQKNVEFEVDRINEDEMNLFGKFEINRAEFKIGISDFVLDKTVRISFSIRITKTNKE